MSIDLKQLRDYIVRPALQGVNLWSAAAEQLVLATGMAESGYQYIDQLDSAQRPGPAYGLWQMERATHDDIWDNWLRWQPDIAEAIKEFKLDVLDDCTQMQGNHYYAAIMCRVHYRRVNAAMPTAGDAHGMASYWKQYYNTPLGAGTVDGFIEKTRAVFQL